jgi:hypothetical protein
MKFRGVTDNFITEISAGAISLGRMDESHMKKGAKKNIGPKKDEVTEG